MKSRKLIHEDYRLGWICTLDCEIKAARALLDEEHEPLQPGCRDDNGYILGCYGSHNVVIAYSSVPGTTAAARTVTNLVRSFPNIHFGLLVGIGGAVPSSPHPSNPVRDIHLGDVVVSEPKGSHGGVLNYDMGKWRNEDDFSIESHLNRPPAILLTAAKKLRADQRFGRGRFLHYIAKATEKLSTQSDGADFSFPGRDIDRLFRSDYIHDQGNVDCQDCDPRQTIKRLPRLSDNPAVHYGLIASGNAIVRSTVIRNRLRDRWNILCFEREAAGLMNILPCLVIRGLCNYSDSHHSDRWQAYAAVVAAAYAKDLLHVLGSAR